MTVSINSLWHILLSTPTRHLLLTSYQPRQLNTVYRVSEKIAAFIFCITGGNSS